MPQKTRMLQKHSLHAFTDFSEAVYNQFGMRIAVLAGFQDDNGHGQVLLYA